MIGLFEADQTRRCLSCSSRDDVKELVFGNGSGYSSSIALCKGCRKDLKMILESEKEDVKNDL